MNKQQINCTVYNCKHCDIKNNHCKLNQIDIINHKEDNPKEATLCNSFKEK